MLGGINMRKMEKYETPEIEITKFEIARGIMEGPGFGEETGTREEDIVDVETSTVASEPDGGPDFGL